MALLEFNRNPSERQIRRFSRYGLSGGCFLLAAILVIRYDAPLAVAALGLCGLASVVLGALCPAWMRIVLLTWMAAAYPFGWIISHALLAALYFLVVTPMGLIMRLCGRDPLARRLDREAATYWSIRPSGQDTARYFRQY